MKGKSLKLNFVMNAILTMSSIIFPLITFRYVSNILLPDGTGKVSFAISLITYFNMFAQLGIPIYGIRICAMVRDDREQLTRTAHELLAINLVVGALSYVALALAIIFVPRLREDRALYIVVSSMILLSAIGMEWLYKALEQYTYIAVRSIVFKVIAMVGMFLLIHQKSDYVVYGGITVFASSAANIINLIHARKYIDFHSVGYYSIHRHLKPVLIFFAMSCATTIYTNLDNVMLVALPLMIFFMLFAEQSIRFLTGGTLYKPATLPMQIIMPTLLFIGITNVLGIQILVPLGREKTVLVSEIVGAVIDLILNAILIPLYGAAGAAIGTLAAEFAVLVVQYIALRSEVRGAFLDIHYFKIFAALIPAVLSAVWVSHLQIGTFWLLVFAAILFFGLYGIVLLLLKEPLVKEIVFGLLSKLKRKNKADDVV